MMWFVAASAGLVGGRLLGADGTRRAVAPAGRGNCRGLRFVALRGERFDDHGVVADPAAGSDTGDRAELR